MGRLDATINKIKITIADPNRKPDELFTAPVENGNNEHECSKTSPIKDIKENNSEKVLDQDIENLENKLSLVANEDEPITSIAKNTEIERTTVDKELMKINSTINNELEKSKEQENETCEELL